MLPPADHRGILELQLTHRGLYSELRHMIPLVLCVRKDKPPGASDDAPEAPAATKSRLRAVFSRLCRGWLGSTRRRARR